MEGLTMRLISTIFFLVFSINSNAKDCHDLDELAIKLHISALNWENRYQTRTADGGPYKKQVVVCSEVDGSRSCIVERSKDAPILKYDPGHPDADKRGYVAYPNFDFQKEKIITTNTAHELIELVENKKCNLANLSKTNSKLFYKISYKNEILRFISDKFIFSEKGFLKAWTRVFKDGRSSVINF